MQNRLVVLKLLACLISGVSHADFGMLSNQLENSPMKSLIGNWDINDSSLTPDGGWQAGAGATWNFYSILNGHAIQDDWISPPENKPEPKNGRQYGTNIRIFNPKENRWEMAWISVKGQKLDQFTAVEEEGKIIMSGFYAGAESRITFFDIKPKSFDWKLEQQQADKKWLEIYRIKANRVVKAP